MKILLVGEFSGVHTNLSAGLKQLGHEVNIAATGDGYKQFPYDHFFARQVGKDNSVAKLLFKYRTKKELAKNKHIFYNNDVVQLINPIFYVSDLILQNIYTFNLLKEHNKDIFLGAYGDDYYWIEACLNGLFRYDMITNNIANHTPDEHLFSSFQESFSKQSKLLNRHVAANAKKIIAGLFEYYHPYSKSEFNQKLTYIPFPVNTDVINYQENIVRNGRIKILLGKQKGRNNWKGINVIESVLDELVKKYPSDIEVIKCESLPFAEYKKLYEEANVVVDQLYSYSPAMNALNSLAAGKVVIGGGEEEVYQLLNETENKPIINITPIRDTITNSIVSLIDKKNDFSELGEKGRRLIDTHHDYLKVAKKYVEVWGTN